MVLHLAVVVLGSFLYANVLEWCIHKFILHDLARQKRFRKILGFHWYRHHRQSRQRPAFFDPDYKDPIYYWTSRTKEVVALLVVASIHLPVVLLSTPAYATMVAYLLAYYVLHLKGHLNPSWARTYIPWHYDHHMGKDQNKNYNVVLPLSDYLFRTRVKYVYTPNGTALYRKR